MLEVLDDGGSKLGLCSFAVVEKSRATAHHDDLMHEFGVQEFAHFFEGVKEAIDSCNDVVVVGFESFGVVVDELTQHF